MITLFTNTNPTVRTFTVSELSEAIQKESSVVLFLESRLFSN